MTICAWCPKQPGVEAPGGALVSHGICADCKAKFIFDVMKSVSGSPRPHTSDADAAQKTVDING